MDFLDWLGVTTSSTPLEIGDIAPDVLARDEQENEVRLSDFYHDEITLIYFYPKADTPGCRVQACALRDSFEELKECGVRVIGVSMDKSPVQFRFKKKYQLPFPLLADPQRVVAGAFGVPLMMGMNQRQSFLVKNGRIVWRDLRASTRSHAQDILIAMARLNRQPSGISPASPPSSDEKRYRWLRRHSR